MRAITSLFLIVMLSLPSLAKGKHHDQDEDHFDCKEKLSDRGDQRTSDTWAHSAADKAWVQSARFKYGELFADLKNARDVKYECVTTGPSGILHRCEITAFPCRAGKEHADK